MVADAQEKPKSWVTVHLKMRRILGGDYVAAAAL